MSGRELQAGDKNDLRRRLHRSLLVKSNEDEVVKSPIGESVLLYGPAILGNFLLRQLELIDISP